jgi:hypothetical protein
LKGFHFFRSVFIVSSSTVWQENRIPDIAPKPRDFGRRLGSDRHGHLAIRSREYAAGEQPDRGGRRVALRFRDGEPLLRVVRQMPVGQQPPIALDPDRVSAPAFLYDVLHPGLRSRKVTAR